MDQRVDLDKNTDKIFRITTELKDKVNSEEMDEFKKMISILPSADAVDRLEEKVLNKITGFEADNLS